MNERQQNINKTNQDKGRADTSTQTSQKNGIGIPSITLPKGGGAISGIGEKFSANPVTGTASLSVPIFTSPGRSGFGPQLSLSYDSGSGNGPFGFGWSLSLPSITRKTDKGLPKYQDAKKTSDSFSQTAFYQTDFQSDVFILSGAEDLVPVFKTDENGKWILDAKGNNILEENERDGYLIRYYRPRIEGLFARIERWIRKIDGDIHWRSISKDNILTVYGRGRQSRISDPLDHSRIFSWLICESYDDKGNAIIYEYAGENDKCLDLSLSNERNRIRTAQRYIKRIKYGNRQPLLLDISRSSFRTPHTEQTDFSSAGWMFEVVFDYDEDHYRVLPPDSTISENEQHRLIEAYSTTRGEWSERPDPFSSYRACFEIRTYRRCRRVLMFHHFHELGDEPYLIRSTEFDYSDFDYSQPFTVDAELEHHGSRRIASFLRAITQSGYVREESYPVHNVSGINYVTYVKKSLPPLELEYSQPIIHEEVMQMDPYSLHNLPYGLDGSLYQWVDLDGEGISGILTEQADSWFYKPNLGGGRFGPLEVLDKPSLANLRKGSQHLMDLAGDGQLDLVALDSSTPGFYERMHHANWKNFTAFTSFPDINWNDPNLKFLDVSGDGLADVLITEDNVFSWYQSLATEGFASAERVSEAHDEEKGPRLVFNDLNQSIYLADMSGDGLSDLVRIRQGEVCYWPNLGYARFGAKVTMDNAPWFDTPDRFDEKRIRLADVDGSGTTDIIYFGTNGVQIYFNQSGNRLSSARHLFNFPNIDNTIFIQVADLLGKGTACLVWSSALPSNTSQPMRYIDLMGGQKPHLLVSSKNNLGAETKISFAASTKFYLSDKAAGKPWITRLPFPVQVVQRVETIDWTTRSRLVTQYAYHHGYYDGIEREFRGFEMVEQWDTETIDQFDKTGLRVPPVYVKTWFHTGFYTSGRTILGHLKDEYYKGDLDEVRLPELLLPKGLSFREKREACRALKGRILRQEVYGLDDSNRAHDPYSVSERNYHLRLLQPVYGDCHAVIFQHEREVVDTYYERNSRDPRIQHRFILRLDDYGNIEQQATVYYPRRQNYGNEIETYGAQKILRVVVDQTNYAHVVNDPDVWIEGVVWQSKCYELKGIQSPRVSYLSFEEVNEAIDHVLYGGILDFGQEFDDDATRLQIRLFKWERRYYWSESLGNPLPLAQIEVPILPYNVEVAVFPVSYVTKVYGERVSNQILENEGGYRKDSGYLWNIGIRHYYLTREHFCLPYVAVDPFGNFHAITMEGSYSKTEYDKYDLIPTKFTDAVGNITNAEIDYRTLQPSQVTDINNNRSQVSFDELGMVVATSILGEVDGVAKGDGELRSFKSFLSATQNDILANPEAFIQDASSFFYYDYFSWIRRKLPAVSLSIHREVHLNSLEPGETSRFQFSLRYSSGTGREVQQKLKVERGPAWVLQSDGSYKEEDSEERWLTSGRTVYNNKGKPAKEYEPFFSGAYGYESEESLVEFGVATLTHYDPLERVIRIDTPKGFFSSVKYNAWTQEFWDENDNVKESRFYDELIIQNKYPPSWTMERVEAEKVALRKTEIHAYTPKIIHLNNISQSFLEVNFVGGKRQATQNELDIEGNKLSIIDPRQYEKNRNRLSSEQIRNFRYLYNMNSKELEQKSTDAGIKKILQNVLNNVIYVWDARGFMIHNTYDALQRPVETSVLGNGLDNLVEKIEYGESILNPERKNLRGKPIKHFDQSGLKEFLCYDIEGHTIKLRKRVRDDYKHEVNWRVDVEPTEEYVTQADFDALGRLVRRTQSDGSTHIFRHHQSGQLKSVAVQLNSGGRLKYYVKDIKYNAKGQTLLIEYGNQTVTTHGYEAETFRLESLKTVRSSDSELLQNITYVYDPVGNISRIKDESHRTIFRNQAKVNPVSSYSYDSAYRLLEANGRQHPAVMENDYKSRDAFKQSRYLSFGSVSINDARALENYFESYEYDLGGNLDKIKHAVERNPSRNWTKENTYAEDSNRLVSSKICSDTTIFSYDSAGNITNLDHPKKLNWNYRNNISSAVLIEREEQNDAEYYVYGSDGTRLKKVLERYIIVGDLRFVQIEEKLYLDGYDIKRIKRKNLQSNTTEILLERYTRHVMGEKKRIALIHSWTKDRKRKETDDVSDIRVHYQLGNHLDSCSLELDDEEHIISYEEYYPYGGTAFISGRSLQSDLAKEVSIKEYRYTSKECDDSTGLYYYGARYYAPWLGRWTNCDPGGIVDGPNLYSYVHNNPIILSDPTGMWSWTTVAVVAAVVVVGAVVTAATAGVAGPLVVGAVASIGLTGTAATVATGVAVGAIAGAVGGAAAGAAGEATREVVHGEQLSGTHILSAAGEGATTGAAVGAAVGGVAAFAATATGTAAIGAVSRVGQRVIPEAIRNTTSAVGRGVVAAARAVGEAPGIKQAISGAGRVLQSTESAAQSAGLRLARGAFSQGSISDMAVSRFATSGNLADAFEAGPPRQYTPNPNIRSHASQLDAQTGKRPAGMQSHHPESQTALSRAIANYDPKQDPTLLMPAHQHYLTFGPQGRQMKVPGYLNRLGTSEALQESANIIQNAGYSAETAGQVTLEHSGYLFSTTPLNQVNKVLK
jgi:RHS repeat-associated protein